jgi:hypothetical protein
MSVFDSHIGLAFKTSEVLIQEITFVEVLSLNITKWEKALLVPVYESFYRTLCF